MSLFKDAWNWITGAAKKLKAILLSGKDIANQVKAITDSPLLDVIVNLTPTDLDNKGLIFLREGLKRFIDAFGWTEKMLVEFEGDPDAKAAALHIISAKASKLLAEYKKVDLNIQQALTAPQLVYDPDKVIN